MVGCGAVWGGCRLHPMPRSQGPGKATGPGTRRPNHEALEISTYLIGIYRGAALVPALNPSAITEADVAKGLAQG